MAAVELVACERGGPNLYRRAWARRRMLGGGSRGGSFPDRGRLFDCQVHWELAALSPFVGALVVRTLVIVSSGCFRFEQDVVAAAGDLAGDGQPCPAAAAAADGAGVQVVVGAGVAVTVVGGLDQRPAEMP